MKVSYYIIHYTIVVIIQSASQSNPVLLGKEMLLRWL